MTGSALPYGKNPKKSDFLGDIAALEAAGANLESHGGTTKLGLYLDDIRLPQTAGVVIGLADLVTAH